MRDAVNETGCSGDYEPNALIMLDAGELSAAIRLRQVSCQEVMAAYLDHIEQINPLVNALVSLRDREQLMAEARLCDEELSRKQYRGWMHGMPQAIKDLSATAGIRTTSGSPLFADHVPDADSIMVERMKRAGAIIIGKTNTPEFGLGSHTYNPVFGRTRNAYDPTWSAGGSSGGAAAALAMRMLPVADGSDMMGSLRNPAAFNNVIGFRPSIGRVPDSAEGDIFGQQLGTAGPMGRSVADVARLLATQAGPDPRVPYTLQDDPACFTHSLREDFSGTRIAWLGDWQGYFRIEPGILDLCDDALSVFEKIGCVVEPAQPDYSPEQLWDTWLTLRHHLVAGRLQQFYLAPDKRPFLKPEAQWEIEGGLGLRASDIYEASLARSAWYQALHTLFQSHDYLLLPTAQVFPFDVELDWPKAIEGVGMDTYHRWMEVTILGSLAGCPAINVPVGFGANGPPMGLQIIGPYQADFDVLKLARAYEQSTEWTQRELPSALKSI